MSRVRLERTPSPPASYDPVLEAYKADLDRSLLRSWAQLIRRIYEVDLLVRTWLECPQTQVVVPGPRDLETQSVLHSNDADFSRFPGLNWKNPLASEPVG